MHVKTLLDIDDVKDAIIDIYYNVKLAENLIILKINTDKVNMMNLFNKIKEMLSFDISEVYLDMVTNDSSNELSFTRLQYVNNILKLETIKSLKQIKSPAVRRFFRHYIYTTYGKDKYNGFLT